MGRETTDVQVEDMLSSLLAASNEAKKLPLLSLNHVSFVCKSIRKSVQFYEEVLGFISIQRPSSFDFEGAWLFNHGVGIHLLEAENMTREKGKINPKDNHISFQCSDISLLIQRLEEMKIEYVKAVVKEGGILVDQIFFHDPDGYMIEICNCQNIPVIPISSCPLKKLPSSNKNLKTSSSFNGNSQPTNAGNTQCSIEVEALMFENLAIEMLDVSI